MALSSFSEELNTEKNTGLMGLINDKRYKFTEGENPSAKPTL